MNEAQRKALDPDLAKTLHRHLRDNAGRGYSVGELGAEFKADVAVVHRHLCRLADADLVEIAWRGTTVIYRAAAEGLQR
jgi:DNA-binding transcriptional ArsR family regulator